jgi:predicted RNA binding protein YcfA (HicA-like mRNA interferase family)
VKPIKAKELFKIASANGWELSRINGSHHIYVKPGHPCVAIPGPSNRDVPGPTAASVIKQLEA